MALRPCRECNAQVSTEAETCPHCGVRNPAETGPTAQPTRKRKSRPGLLIAFFVLVGVVILVIYSLSPEHKKTPEELAHEQVRQQEEQVRQQEQQNYSADFGRLSVAGRLAVATKGAEKFDISGWNRLDLYIANRSDLRATSLAEFFCGQCFKPPLNLGWKVRVYLADNSVGAECSIR